jgi:hypothetical protein
MQLRNIYKKKYLIIERKSILNREAFKLFG